MRRKPLLTLTIAAALLLPAASALAQATPPAAGARQDAKARQLDALYAEYWEALLKLNPLRATFQGDARYNDQLPNYLSAASRQREHAFLTQWLKKVQDVGEAGLDGQDLLSYRIFVDELTQALEGEQFPSWMLPVDQFSGLTSVPPLLGAGTGAQPFKTAADYDAWAKRMQLLPALFDQAIANMREGVKAKVVQPKALMLKVLPQLDAIIKPKAEDTLFWGPIKTFPDAVSAADRQRLTAEYRQRIETDVIPAYRRLRDYIAKDYLTHARDTAGMQGLPNGQAWYAYNARVSTTTDMAPARIHQIGLDEVARIHGLIRQIMVQTGFKGSLQDFFKFMQDDPRFSFKSEEALLSAYRALEARIDQRIPEQFSLLPKAGFEIRPVEAFRAESAAGGEYMSPSEDGTRPGIFYVNTFDLPTRKTWDAEDLYLHEAIPGHHFQLALQQELTGIPKFRRFGGQTAFIEGWGLYAESLGKDLGVYEDPYSYFGYLQNELWRAIRLVVDTGLHDKGWSREQVIDYMMANSAASRTDAVAEAERYMAIPGQALAYKVGEMKIQELRKRAQAALGADFDARAFHAQVLEDGSLPLAQLEQKIDRWIASRKR
ncbi:DUF885 domain-containing protein [Pseudoxanthomonas composti]|uniref:DUF885 family protein n=1 Tax=Pseudoxanthomonas composti TaxID=2137479 RepID=A0A4Q1JYN6_9GAMM|nr:DUF885 family protein [Pseudoxanthomonas composti]